MVGLPHVVWHGTVEEGNALVEALSHHCDCVFGLMGARTVTCTVHKMLLDDQHWLDHLVYMRRLNAAWKLETL